MQAKPVVVPAMLTSSATREYRVVQWATGTIGARALRADHRTSAHDLRRRLRPRAGQGGPRRRATLCGVASTGVTATASIDEIVELGPTASLCMPNSLDLDELCRLHSRRASTSSRPAAHSTTRRRWIPRSARRCRTACELGGASVHAPVAALDSSPRPSRWCSPRFNVS